MHTDLTKLAVTTNHSISLYSAVIFKTLSTFSTKWTDTYCYYYNYKCYNKSCQKLRTLTMSFYLVNQTNFTANISHHSLISLVEQHIYIKHLKCCTITNPTDPP